MVCTPASLSVTTSTGEHVFFATGKHVPVFNLLFFSLVESLLLLVVVGFAERSSRAVLQPSCCLVRHEVGARVKLVVACSHLCCANPLCAFVPKDASYSKYEQEVWCDPADSISMEPCWSRRYCIRFSGPAYPVVGVFLLCMHPNCSFCRHCAQTEGAVHQCK